MHKIYVGCYLDSAPMEQVHTELLTGRKAREHIVNALKSASPAAHTSVPVTAKFKHDERDGIDVVLIKCVKHQTDPTVILVFDDEERDMFIDYADSKVFPFMGTMSSQFLKDNFSNLFDYLRK